jgi:hypothetical protein
MAGEHVGAVDRHLLVNHVAVQLYVGCSDVLDVVRGVQESNLGERVESNAYGCSRYADRNAVSATYAPQVVSESA